MKVDAAHVLYELKNMCSEPVRVVKVSKPKIVEMPLRLSPLNKQTRQICLPVEYTCHEKSQSSVPDK